MDSIISLAVSFFALFISGLTAWLTLLKRATVKMTQPTTVYFGPDTNRSEYGPKQKVYFRTLLYATAKRGCIVESMFIRLRRDGETQNFNVWVYGEERLTRGSGLFIPQEGLTTNHHFLLPFDGTAFSFLPGAYAVDVFASVLGEKSVRLLRSIMLEVSTAQAVDLSSDNRGLYFDWSPDAVEYHSHARTIPRREPNAVNLMLGFAD